MSVFFGIGVFDVEKITTKLVIYLQISVTGVVS